MISSYVWGLLSNSFVETKLLTENDEHDKGQVRGEG